MMAIRMQSVMRSCGSRRDDEKASQGEQRKCAALEDDNHFRIVSIVVDEARPCRKPSRARRNGNAAMATE
jgi:hypothetical protein